VATVRRGADAGGDAKRPSQETRRSNLDDISLAAPAVGGEGGAEGRFSTPATLEETYTVCDSQVWNKGGRAMGICCCLALGQRRREVLEAYHTLQR